MATITQLEYLIAVEEEKHFGKAAERCHVSQPSLSIQIQKLEEELEVVIFDRSKKPILTTETGMGVIDQARQVLKEHRKLKDIAHLGSVEPQGTFHIAVIPTLSPYLIPLFLENFSKAHPKVKLKISEYQTEDIIKALKNDAIDAGLLVTPLKDEALIERHLFFEPFYAFVSDGHPLFKRKLLDEGDLLGEDLWLLEEGHCFRDQMLRVCSTRNKKKVLENVEFASGSLETLKNMVRLGEGFTLLPELATKDLKREETQQNLKKFKKPVPTREVSLVHSRSFLKETIIQALEKTIIESLPQKIHSLKKDDVNIIPID